MTRPRPPSLAFWASIAIAVLLSLMPLPDAWRALKPFWLALVVVYWALEAPDRMGLGVAFALGVLGDLLTGSLLGEQALRLTVMAFIVLRLRARMRFFPMPQQALAVLALLVNDRIVMLMIRSFAGSTAADFTWWLAPVVGAMLWPWVFLLLDGVRLRQRSRDA